MKRVGMGVVLGALVAAAVMLPMGKSELRAADKPPAWRNLQNLAGEWNVEWDGKKATIAIRSISDGSALMEEQPGESMVTMYHLDNGNLMMTHYCAAHNQPRMVGEASADGKSIAFKFLDATNLASLEDGHMDRMTMVILDNDHVDETWVFVDHGKTQSDTFHLTRKK